MAAVTSDPSCRSFRSRKGETKTVAKLKVKAHPPKEPDRYFRIIATRADGSRRISSSIVCGEAERDACLDCLAAIEPATGERGSAEELLPEFVDRELVNQKKRMGLHVFQVTETLSDGSRRAIGHFLNTHEMTAFVSAWKRLSDETDVSVERLIMRSPRFLCDALGQA